VGAERAGVFAVLSGSAGRPGVRNDWFRRRWCNPSKLTQLTLCHPRFLGGRHCN